MRPEDIARTDFPTSRRGLDPQAVDEHLRAVAEHVAKLGQRLESAERSPAASQGIGGVARDKVLGMLEAVERSTDEIESEARREAATHVESVRGDVERLRERIGTLDGVLTELSERSREGLDRLVAELAAVEAEIGALRPHPAVEASDVLAGLHELAADEGEAPERIPEAGGPDAMAAAPDVEEEPAAREEPPAEPEPAEAAEPEATEPEAAEAEAAEAAETKPPGAEVAMDGDGGADSEAARIVALDMALEGTPREEAVRRLSEEFELADPQAIVDEVYDRAG